MSNMAELEIILPGHPSRQEAENLVKSVYASHYGARVSIFPDMLAALMTRDGSPCCVAGLRIGIPDCFGRLSDDGCALLCTFLLHLLF